MNRKGTILFEVVLSIGILATLSAAASVIIVTSLYANSFNKNSLIAVNLAEDGVEVVRNIRDTNWLKYSTEPETKWDLYNKLENKRLEKGGATYVPAFDSDTNRYFLQLYKMTTNPFNLDELDETQKTKINVRKINIGGVDIYSNSLDGLGEETPFYRTVVVTCNAPVGPNCDEYEIISRVQWEERGKVQTIERTSYISNYLK